jgi:hypothetical protein
MAYNGARTVSNFGTYSVIQTNADKKKKYIARPINEIKIFKGITKNYFGNVQILLFSVQNVKLSYERLFLFQSKTFWTDTKYFG